MTHNSTQGNNVHAQRGKKNYLFANAHSISGNYVITQYIT